MKPIKILFSDNNLWGLIHFRGGVINYFAVQEIEVVLVAPDDPRAEREKLAPQVRIVPVKLSRTGKNLFSDFGYFNALCSIYRKERPDYIFHYTIKPNIYGTFAARVCRIPSTAMIAGLGYVYSRVGLTNLLGRTLYKAAMRYPEHVFVLNRNNKDILIDRKVVRPDRVVLLAGGEGIDLLRYVPSNVLRPVGGKIFLMIARLLYDKGYAEYVRAAKSIREKYPDAEFRILGTVDSDYPRHVKRKTVEKDQTDGFIRYLGYVTDVAPHIEQADCIVLPSYHEGLSRVLMEAIAMGKPVICSNIAGCRETIEDGKNGFLANPKDPYSLIEAMEKFLAVGEDTHLKMGRYSREKAEREFDERFVIARYREILKIK